MKDGEGILGQTCPLIAFLPSTKEFEEKDWPDVQLHILPILMGTKKEFKGMFRFSEDFWHNYLKNGMTGKHGISFSYCLLRPKSR